MWHERGELDKLIDRSLEQMPGVGPQPTVIVQEKRSGEFPKYRDDDYYKYKKRESVMDEIFDF